MKIEIEIGPETEKALRTLDDYYRKANQESESQSSLNATIRTTFVNGLDSLTKLHEIQVFVPLLANR